MSTITPVKPTQAAVPGTPWTEVTWEDDYADRCNPELFTRLLQAAVPALQSVNWAVVETDEGFARTVLPLVHESTNHNGTHQAALMLLAADYTGGVALASFVSRFSGARGA